MRHDETGAAPAAARPQAQLRRFVRPVQEFIDTESAGGIILVAAALLALVWANSPWSDAYHDLLEFPLAIDLGLFRVDEPLHFWVNDVAMVVFFFLVGMEIKRELVVGELRSLRRVAVPLSAALGGMLVPLGLFLLVARGADVAEVGRRLYHSQEKCEFDLLRVIYANTKTVANGQVSYSSASYDEIHDAGCTAADIDEQINVPRSLNGVRLAMLFSEGNKSKTRINFRGSGNVTVVELAAEFNGGGHSQSAGAILDCGLEEAVERVLPRAVEHLKKFS